MLTARRVNGIREGYWSAARKELLAQKLGALEEHGPRLVLDACVRVCIHRGPLNSQDAYCRDCPLKKLGSLIREDQ